ncbi:YigZ family protein [Gangjinia marincola]|uniref:YigZ family protein n=1 Tax=Gangjinia marincola TaxID=578463 RepID=A0ABP3XQQ4_9FLAO
MTREKDTYNTILAPVEGILFKDRNSKFFGYAFPVTNEDDIKKHLDHLKKEHYQAGHFCYAWQLSKSYDSYRANDDGEPSNSAGMPIYGQLQSYDLTNVLVVVLRYYGGTKLGVGGLINAYRTTAQLTIEEAKIIEKTIDIEIELSFEYPLLNKVMCVIKEKNLDIVAQEMTLTCKMTLAIRKNDLASMVALFEAIYGITVKELD